MSFGAVLTSSNTVGYQLLGVTSENMYNWKVSTFDKVGSGVTTLGDISVDDDFGASYLSFLNPDGTTKTFSIPEIIAEGGEPVAGFNYLNAEAAADAGLDAPGWYYIDTEYTFSYYCFNDVEVPFGSMFYIEAEGPANIVSSGTVAAEAQPIEVTSDKQFNFTGNCSPSDLTLGDIGVDSDFGGSLLSFLNPDGTTKTFSIPEIIAEGGEPVSGFNYLNEEDAADLGLAGPGWYYIDAEYTYSYYSFNSVSVPAGSMFYIEAEGPANVIIPSAL